MTELARLFRPAALIFKAPDPAVLAQAIAGAKPLELAVLIAGDAGRSGCGGRERRLSHRTGVRMLAKRETVLGSAGIVGAACGLSRHAAMESAEAGADFIAFDASDPDNLGAGG